MALSFGAVTASAAPKLNYTSFSLTQGYSTTLKVTGNSGAVSWSSSDASVATVNASGKVVGKGVGNATISAKVDGTTLRASVTVVATKITADKSSVTLTKGQSTTVTLTVTGSKTGLTLSNGSSSIAKGSWNGAKWNGNKITFKITANAPGTTSITVYRKNYRSSYYKTITVTVPGQTTNPSNPTSPANPSSTAKTIQASAKTMSIAVGANSTFQTYNSNPANLAVYSYDSSVASVTMGTTSGYYRTHTVNGLKAGTTTVRVYDRTDQSYYIDLVVTVTGSTYYTVATSRPTPSAREQVITFQKNATTYYMLVPYDYDSADVNSAIAKYFKSYDYYTVYADYPTVKAAGDSIQYVTVANTGYPTTTAGTPYRYIMLPANYDQVKYRTAVSEYTNVFEYYTIYSVRPNIRYNTDTVQSWQIIDSSGANVLRYVLLPSPYDTDRLATLKNADLENSTTFTYYKVLTSFPVNPGNANDVFSWYNSKVNATRYMIIPKVNCDFVARNDAIYNDTGIYCYFNVYSTAPTVKDAAKEQVTTIYVQSGGKSVPVYILIDKTDKDYEAKIQSAYTGTYYYNAQGTYAGTSAQY
jgi:hypothetical protein